MRAELARALVAAAAALLSGCAVGPGYARDPDPIANLPSVFADGLFSAEQVDRYWWLQFRDPTLSALVDDALANNRDLAVAEARWREARSTLSLSNAALYPSGNVEFGYEKARRSQATLYPGAPRNVELYSAGMNVAWELDLIGGIRRAVEAARADEGAAAAAVHAVQVAVTAEVARTYLALRGAQARLRLARENARAQSGTLRLTQTRLEVGRGNAFDVARAQSQYDLTVATMPTLESMISASTHRLAVLTGKQPAARDAELLMVRPAPLTPVLSSIGTPAQLLRRRPDIQEAERRLASLTAQVGVATAELYPKVGFIGSVSTVSSRGSSLGNSASQGYSIMPGVRWDLLDLGRVRLRIAQADARASAALAAFEKVMLVALEETENALAEYGANIQRRTALQSNEAAAGRAATLARQRYRDGVTSFLDVLEAERSLLSAQDQLAQTEQAAGIALVAVYAALGGGWTQPDVRDVSSGTQGGAAQ